jgi:hypothetical protein
MIPVLVIWVRFSENGVSRRAAERPQKPTAGERAGILEAACEEHERLARELLLK